MDTQESGYAYPPPLSNESNTFIFMHVLHELVVCTLKSSSERVKTACQNSRHAQQMIPTFPVQQIGMTKKVIELIHPESRVVGTNVNKFAVVKC